MKRLGLVIVFVSSLSLLASGFAVAADGSRQQIAAPAYISLPGQTAHALECGDDRAAASEMRCRRLRDRRGDTRAGWCGGREAGSHPARGGPSRGVPMRHAAHPGSTAAGVGGAPCSVAIGRIPGTAINGSIAGGPVEQASNTARGTPGNRRNVANECLCTRYPSSYTGPWGVRRPGVPRTLGLL
jgi:hypothetical protein